MKGLDLKNSGLTFLAGCRVFRREPGRNKNQQAHLNSKERRMSDVETSAGRTQFVWVKDKAGNEFVCDVGALRDPKNVSDDDLKNCVDDAKSPQPFAGG